jgi:hypothetical protein
MEAIDNNKVKIRLWHKIKNMSPAAKRTTVDVIKIGSVSLLTILISVLGFVGVRYLDGITTQLTTFNNKLNEINITVAAIKEKQSSQDAITANCVNNVNDLDTKLSAINNSVTRLDVAVADLKENYRRKLFR